jgi:hypothetical protein
VRPRPIIGFLLIGTLFWAGATTIAGKAAADAETSPELMYYPSGRMIQEAALGYHHAAAALTWIRTVQYYGEHVTGDRVFDMMYHMCDVVTDLDPNFLEPYMFGSFVLITEGRNPAQAMELLHKGRERNPHSWRVFFETGFVYYIAWRDPGMAAAYFRKAATLPGAPEYVDRFAAFVSMKSGELETSLLLWQELAERSDNEALRRKARLKVEELERKIAERDGGKES